MSGAYPGIGEERARSAVRGRRGHKRAVVHRATGIDLALQPQRTGPPDSGGHGPDPLVKRPAGGHAAVPFPVSPQALWQVASEAHVVLHRSQKGRSKCSRYTAPTSMAPIGVSHPGRTLWCNATPAVTSQDCLWTISFFAAVRVAIAERASGIAWEVSVRRSRLFIEMRGVGSVFLD